MTTDFSAISASADLLQLAERAGTQMRKQGSEWRGCCPLHRGNNPTGFAIYSAKGRQSWHCFTGDCGSGDALDFVMKLQNVSIVEAARILTGGRELDPDTVTQLNAERAARAARQLEEQIARAQAALDEIRRTESWIKYNEALQNDTRARNLWRVRGVPDEWQDYYRLGYNADFVYYTAGEPAHSPTLTIPIYAQGWQPVNVRHRILQPVNPKDKYRPERSGLPALPFVCNPDLADSPRVLVVEGEVKAIVTYLTLDQPDMQVVGIPGKSQAARLVDELKGRQIWVCLDPDGKSEAESLARAVDGFVVSLRIKIDDAITQGALDRTGLRNLLNSARRPM